MFDFGDEFVIESYRIPWLIWVQLLVMILLLIVLVFGLGIFTLDDLSDNPNSASSSSLTSSDFRRNKPPFNATTTTTTSSCSYSSKVGVKESDDRKTDDPAGTSKAGIIDEDENIEIKESSSGSDIAICRVFGRADHPCNYFDIVKEVFLKCLGLGESSKQRKHGGGGKRKD